VIVFLFFELKPLKTYLFLIYSVATLDEKYTRDDPNDLLFFLFMP